MSTYHVTINSAGYTEYGTGWSTAVGWAAGGYRSVNSPTADHYVEYSFSVPSGYYDLYWHTQGAGSSWTDNRMFTVTDGSNLSTQRNFFAHINERGGVQHLGLGYGNIYKIVAQRLHTSGTLTIKNEKEPRKAFGSNLLMTGAALVTTTPIIENNTVDPTYTPTSNKSKPHPLYTN